MGDTDR